MADIRINALATTASSTASDDFLAVDGSANGTRKLSAYSPTFGGNLTVSGTATLGPTNPFKFDTNLMQSTASGFNGALVRSAVSTVGNPTFSNVDDTDTGIYFPAANTLAITTGGTQRLSVDATATTLAGNLTVSGGTITSGSGTLTLNSSANTVVLQSAGTTALTLDSSQNATFAGRIRVSGFDSTYYNANEALLGNATYNPKLALASTLGYTWTARTNDVGGAGEFIVRYEEGSKDLLTIDRNGNTVVNSAAIATNATNGFLYVPSCAGTPTGTPTTYTGRVPIVVDTTNNKLYFYSGGAWRDAGP